jgi:hypothetical protein
LALATLARMVTNAFGALRNPALAPPLRWAPVLCWAIAGVLLLALALALARAQRIRAARAA